MALPNHQPRKLGVSVHYSTLPFLRATNPPSPKPSKARMLPGSGVDSREVVSISKLRVLVSF